MTGELLLLPIIIPFIFALLVFLVPNRLRALVQVFVLFGVTLHLAAAIALFGKDAVFSLPWVGMGIEFVLRSYHFNSFINLAIASFGFLIAVYSALSMSGKPHLRQFFGCFLLTLVSASGAVLSDNLVAMLFFWEGSLLSVFGMISAGNKNAFKTATKSFIIIGITDLCLLVGIVLTASLAGTLKISEISLSLGGVASLAFILLMIGAVAKSGSMPFHSWIPDAAIDAPLPFMALVPAAIEKIMGIYLLTRISLDMFKLNADSWLSVLMMSIGAFTIVLAVMMALIQKDYKKLLSYHAISQVGYMILGIGTALPVGIIGGIFHMINHTLYKSCLFLTGGSVEKQTGTTNLEHLGGIGIKMPVTFACFTIAALAISGVWPLNGFFSKELVYDGALERGLIFYIAAAGGSFFTAASFLKLGHAAFLGKRKQENEKVKEASFAMLLPMIILALLCVCFGLFNAYPLKNLIQPGLGNPILERHVFSGFPANKMLVVITFIVLIGALVNHLIAVRIKGSALKAADEFYHAPVLSVIYDKAEKGLLDPYNIGMVTARIVAKLAFYSDRAIDWLYEGVAVKLGLGGSRMIRRVHSGSYIIYLFWSLAGSCLVVGIMLCIHR